MSKENKIFDEIFSSLAPDEPSISASDKEKVWAGIKARSSKENSGKATSNRFQFRYAAVALAGMAAAFVCALFLFRGGYEPAQDSINFESVARYIPEGSGDVRLVLSDRIVKLASHICI